MKSIKNSSSKGFAQIVVIFIFVLLTGVSFLGLQKINNNQSTAKVKIDQQKISQASASAEKVEEKRAASEAAQKKAEQEKQKALEEALRLATLAQGKEEEKKKQEAMQTTTQTAVTNNPGDGYSRITVSTSRGNFTVNVIKADLTSGVRVVTDSAEAGECENNCAALSLADYVSRNGGFAGINGTYFCPPDYPSCAGKTNTFHWFLFNARTGNNINAGKRDYSNAGSVFVFRRGSVQFFRDPQGFGLDTTITGAIACFPTLLSGGQIILDEGLLDDKQKNTKGNRGGLANKGNTIYLMIAQNATVPDLAAIMQSMGLENGINLDGGGSSAMWWYGGYKAGPGRNLPNAIVLVRG